MKKYEKDILFETIENSTSYKDTRSQVGHFFLHLRNKMC